MGEKCINVVIGRGAKSVVGGLATDMDELKRADAYRYWVYQRVCEVMNPVGGRCVGMEVLPESDAATKMTLSFCLSDGLPREGVAMYWDNRAPALMAFAHSVALNTTFSPLKVTVTVHDRFPRSPQRTGDCLLEMLPAGDEHRHLRNFIVLIEGRYPGQYVARINTTPGDAHVLRFFRRDWPNGGQRTEPVDFGARDMLQAACCIRAIQPAIYQYIKSRVASSDAKKETLDARRPPGLARERPQLGAIYIASEPTPAERAEVLVLLKRVTDAELVDSDALEAYVDAVIGDDAAATTTTASGRAVARRIGRAVALCRRRESLTALAEFLKAALFLGGHVLDAETLRVRIVRRFTLIQAIAKAFDPECATLCGYICVALQVDAAKMPAPLDKAETRLRWALERCHEPHRLFGVLRYLDELMPPGGEK